MLSTKSALQVFFNDTLIGPTNYCCEGYLHYHRALKKLYLAVSFINPTWKLFKVLAWMNDPAHYPVLVVATENNNDEKKCKTQIIKVNTKLSFRLKYKTSILHKIIANTQSSNSNFWFAILDRRFQWTCGPAWDVCTQWNYPITIFNSYNINGRCVQVALCECILVLIIHSNGNTIKLSTVS